MPQKHRFRPEGVRKNFIAESKKKGTPRGIKDLVTAQQIVGIITGMGV